MKLHIGIRQAWPQKPSQPYNGVRMIDEVEKKYDRTPLLERRLKEYTDYVERGGILSEYDMNRTDLVEES
jgi:hypothetical protein